MDSNNTEDEETQDTLALISVALNALPCVLTVILLFSEKKYSSFFLLPLIAYPIIMLFVNYLSDGKIKYIGEKGNHAPALHIGIIVSAITQNIISKDYFVLDYNKIFFIYIAAYAVIFLLVYLIFNFSEINKDYSLIILPLVLSLFFSFNSVQIVNGVFDKSEPNSTIATVTEKRKSGGKHNSYYIKIKSSDDESHLPISIKVKSAFYYKVDKNSKVELSVYDGFLYIPWYKYKIIHW